jgi:hypothetical protein
MRKTHYELYEETYSFVDKGAEKLDLDSIEEVEKHIKRHQKAGKDAVMQAILVATRIFDRIAREGVTSDTTLQELLFRPRVINLAYVLRNLGRQHSDYSENSDSESQVFITRNWQQAQHELAGKRVYEVSTGLAQRLMNTELRGLKGADLRLPFKSIYIQFPTNLGLQCSHPVTGLHSVEGAYITESYEPLELDDDGNFLSRKRSWLILLVAKGHPTRGESDDALFTYAVTLKDEDSLDDIIQYITNNNHLSEKGRQRMADEYGEQAIKSFKFLLNVIMYATSSDMRADHVQLNKERDKLTRKLSELPKSAKHAKKRKELLEKLRKAPEYKRIVLGPHIPVWKDEDMYECVGKKMVKRTLVQGHHKSQPYGPKSSLRKRIFIEPYWKGSIDDPEPTPERRVLK